MKMIFQHPCLAYYTPDGEYNEDINEEGQLLVSGKYEVCPDCDGHGHHFRTDLDEDALYRSMSEDGDYEGIARYLDGAYDQFCTRCQGQRVIKSPELPHWALKLLFEWHKEEIDHKRYSDM